MKLNKEWWITDQRITSNTSLLLHLKTCIWNLVGIYPTLFLCLAQWLETEKAWETVSSNPQGDQYLLLLFSIHEGSVVALSIFNFKEGEQAQTYSLNKIELRQSIRCMLGTKMEHVSLHIELSIKER